MGNLEKNRKGWMARPKDLKDKPGPCQELWNIFPVPNCSEISRDFLQETGIKKTDGTIWLWFRGTSKDVPSQFMDWARTKKKPPSYEPGGGDRGSAGVVEVFEPRPTFEADPACRQGQLCVQFSRLLQLLLDTFATASRDDAKRAEILAALERIAAELRRCVAG
jgi:hypothetical protein